MAIGFVLGPGSSSTLNQSSYTFSYTPSLAGLTVVLGLVHSVASGTIGDVTSVTGPSLTGMTKINTVGINTNATPTKKAEVWVGTSVGTSAQTITVAVPDTPTGLAWILTEASGVDTLQGTNGVIQSVTNFSDASSTAFTATLAAFGDASNMGVTIGGCATAQGWASAGSWTRLQDTNYSTPNTGAGAAWGTTTAVTMTWAGPAAWGGIAIELAALLPSVSTPGPLVSPTAVHRAANW